MANFYALPSRVAVQRDQQERAFRLVLTAHRPVRSAETLLGCACGWAVPNGLSGEAAHINHVARQLAGETR